MRIGGGRTETVAVGTLTGSAAGTGEMRVRLRPGAVRLLSHHRGAGLKLMETFDAPGSAPFRQIASSKA